MPLEELQLVCFREDAHRAAKELGYDYWPFPLEVHIWIGITEGAQLDTALKTKWCLFWNNGDILAGKHKCMGADNIRDHLNREPHRLSCGWFLFVLLVDWEGRF